MMRGKQLALEAHTLHFRELYDNTPITYTIRGVVAVGSYDCDVLLRLNGSAEWDVSVQCSTPAEARDFAGELARRMEQCR